MINKKLLKVVEDLKSDFEDAKRLGTFDLLKFATNENSPLIVGKRIIKSVPLGHDSEFREIFELYRSDEQFSVVLWHFKLLQENREFECETRKQFLKLGLARIPMPEDRDNSENTNICLDHIGQINIFDYFNSFICEHKEYPELYDAIKHLNKNQQIIVKKILEGKKQIEISKELNKSKDNVSKTIKRIIANLKLILEKSQLATLKIEDDK